MEQKTKWIDVNGIQKEYLPISKKKIRKIITENLDVVRTSGKLLVERAQLEAWLRLEI